MNLRSLFRQPVLTVAFHSSEARWSLGRGERITSGKAELPEGVVVDGVVAQPTWAGEVLRQHADFPGRWRMQVALALPAQRTVVRQISVPPVAEKQFAEMASREIRREMPTSSENAYVSWKRVTDRDDSAVIFAVAVPRDIMDSHVAAGTAAALQPQSADLRIVAAARAIGDPDCVVVNVEDDEAEIAVFRHGLPNVIRTVSLARSEEQQAWARQLGDELSRTLKFYRDAHRHDEMAGSLPIKMVGAASDRALASEELRETAGADVDAPLLRLPLAGGSEFAANVGLAMKDLAA